jgi:peptidoglycan/LPS O-acetylase OafA/YrhL
MERNRYADLLRVLSIGVVVYAHWLLVAITYASGQLSGVDSMNYISWGPWATLVFQVMPVFFLIGGYVNAQSWPAHRARGETWIAWVRNRALRLLWPTAVFVLVAVLATSAVLLAGVPGAVVGPAARVIFIHLWFLAVYLLMAVLTPALVAAHRRWGLWVVVVAAVAAALVSAVGRVPGLHVIGLANYLFVWGAAHQCGIAWQDGTLTRRRWLPYAMFAGGTVLLACLVAPGLYDVNMLGADNNVPPSIAFLGFALAQCGLVLALEPVGARIMRRAAVWRRVRRQNTFSLSVYLWHFVPVFIGAVAFYPTGLFPQSPVGSAEWWATRPVWFALLTIILVALVRLVQWAQRPLSRIPAGIGRPGPWSPALLLAGLAAVIFGLARLYVGGPAPGGRLSVLALAAFAAGLLAIFCTGRPSGTSHPASAGDVPNTVLLPWRIALDRAYRASACGADRSGALGGRSPSRAGCC